MTASLSKASRSNYDKCLQEYNRFASQFTKSSDNVPVNTGILILYLSHLNKLGYASSTIISKLSAINYCHRLLNNTDLSAHFLVKKFVTGLSKLSSNIDLRVPITPPLLIQLCSSAHLVTKGVFYISLYKAMMSLSFFAFIRPGEITQSHNNIQFNQVQVQSGQLSITFVSFKHHRGPPVTLIIKSQASNICPVTL